MIRLMKKDKPEGIWAGNMKEGDVGVIISWSDSRYLGMIVQRCGNTLFGIGSMYTWNNMFDSKDKPEGIWAGNMKEGDVGVIISWSDSRYLGMIVQRCGNTLFGIGSMYTWNNMFDSDVYEISTNYRVRLLEKGETLIVV